MSNYLQNLIAKSFNQAEVARPRLASMFEPLAPSAPMTFGELRAVERLDFETEPRDARSTNTLQENWQDTEPKKALPLPTMNQPSEKIETPVWRGNQQSVTLEQKVAQKFNEPKPQPTRQQNAETKNENALPSGRALIKREDKTPSRQSLQPLSKMPVQSLMQNESVQIRRPINVQLAEREMKESNITDLSVASQSHKITVQPRIALPVENQKAHGNMPPAFQQPLVQAVETPATPTINVTIGRIEIRATTAATQPRKPTPAAQTLSLDEYLRQCNRGGRE